ncbi:unnamed protein product [Urochloa decumbens]|uniref:Uncharacterized protein n=1 Tax=Urochloa decumbens TaxID=240449 RepID=A0ABC9AUB5_9POAL
MELVVGASSGAVKSLVGKLGSLLAQEYTLIRGVRDDIQYINDELASMQAFLNLLKRAPPPGGHDEQRQDWMKQVREVAYDIEDCVDDVSHRLGGEPRGSGIRVYLRRKWYLLRTLYARHCIASEIGNLKARAQHVSERRTRYGVGNPQTGNGSGNSAEANGPRDRPAPPPQLIGTMEPVGIEEAMKKLEQWIAKVNRDTGRQLRFLAIVGFGGVGKTTVAMALYNKLGDTFHYRAYVLASQKFNLLTVLRDLFKQLHEQQAGASKIDLNEIDGWKEGELKDMLASQLRGKRTYILVDDIWSVSTWENIRDNLPIREMGGSIVVTTRFKSVAEACRRQNGEVYEHEPLLEENSCKLFHQVISSSGFDCPSRFINREVIMKTCRGLPLAIIVVAGLVASKLRSDTGPKLYHHIAQVGKDLPDLENNPSTEGVTHIVNHCYNQLPAELKTCLLYLSMFPKGCLISRKRLIRKWIAEGFITEKHGKTDEEVAEDCFNELISRNLIRAVDNSNNGKVKSCQVHDMVLEYIFAKSRDENFITVVGGHWHTPFPCYKVRRLSIHKSDRQEKDMVQRMKLSHVRSLNTLGSFKSLHSTMAKFQILQVLDLEGCKDLSSDEFRKICSMHQLKYLSLRRTDIEKISERIGWLQYLEVLDIRETNVTRLPPSVERLQRMVHLLAGNKSKRIALTLSQEMTKMMALQTLSGIEIILSNELCPLAALENLTNLKKLTIYKLVRLNNDDDALQLQSAIEHLSSCSLKFLAIDDDFTGFLDKWLEDSKAPPEHLHTLGLLGKLSNVPDWVGNLHNLEKLTLSLTALRTETFLVLRRLPQLFSLIFSLDTAKNDASVLNVLHKNTLKSGGRVIVPKGLKKLKLLRFVAPVMPALSFMEGAMPELQMLELRFLMIEDVFGLESLKSLQQVVLVTSSSQAYKDAKAKATHIKELASKIPNGPRVAVYEYNYS